MNFLRPERIFIFNLCAHSGSFLNFNRAMCRKFYHSRHFVDRTCEKVGLKNARLFKEYFRRRGPGVALSNVAFSSCAAQKVKCYMNFSGPEKIFIFNLCAHSGSFLNFNRAMCRKFYHSNHLLHRTCQKVGLKNARAFQRIFLSVWARSCAQQRSLSERRKSAEK